ncbi:homogeneously-staining region [Tanacetum coccineum]
MSLGYGVLNFIPSWSFVKCRYVVSSLMDTAYRMSDSVSSYMSQRKYALELLKCGNVLNDKPISTPLDPVQSLNLTDGEPLPDPSLYRTLVGKLIYLTITRSDISFAAQLLSKFSQAPRTPHMKTLLRVLRYIKLCLGQGLHFPTTNNLQLTAYCNSDWDSCPVTRRSVI